MALTVITAATDYPLEIADANDHLRGIYDDDDSHLKRLILAASGYVEGYLGRALLNTVYDETFADWTDDKLRVSRIPIVSVTSVKYYDSDNTQQTWTSTNYITNTETGEIEIAPDVTLPEVESRLYPWTVRYTAGYGTRAADIPETIQQALRMLVEEFDRHRGDLIVGTISSPVAASVRRLLALNETGLL